MSRYNGPKFWQPLKETVDAVYGKSIIAGGCLRDWIVSKNLQPKDIDFFVPVTSELDLEMKIFDLEEHGFRHMGLKEPTGKTSYEGRPGELVPNIVAVLEGVGVLISDTGREQPFLINIIGKQPEKIEDPMLLLEDFDHSLCQFASVNGTDIIIHPEAQKTLDTGEISVYTPDKGNTQQRLKKLSQRSKVYSDRFKFPEFKEISKQASVKLAPWDLSNIDGRVNIWGGLEQIRPIADILRGNRL